MRIVIVGAGAVGSYLAMRLSSEGQDVILVESDAARAAELQDDLDALVVTGNGASSVVLKEHGAEGADLLIAVSNSDGVNALACHAARRLGVHQTVARIEDPEMRDGVADLGVDVVIDPGEMAATELVTLIRERGVSDLIEFGEGRLTLLGGIVRRGSPLLDRSLAALRSLDPHANWVVTGIVRNGKTISVRGDTTVAENDHVLLMVQSDDVPSARRLLGFERASIERVVILGSTRVAEIATDLLIASGIEVALVDHEEARCRALADRHPKALVLLGDPTDPDVLSGLTISETDAVAALSGWDDQNLTGCLVAKALGASVAVCRFHRLSYVSLLGGTQIDATVSSRLAASNAILRLVRRGRIRSVATFKDTRAEALDIEVTEGSPAANRLLQELHLPRAAVVGGVLRDGESYVPRGRSEILPGDRLIVFAPPEAINEIEALCGS